MKLINKGSRGNISYSFAGGKEQLTSLSQAERGMNEGFSSTDISIRDETSSPDAQPGADGGNIQSPSGERGIDVGDDKVYKNEAFQVESPDGPSHGSSSEQAMSGYGDSTSAEHEVKICLI